MTATILRADARAIPLPDASVDLIVTSPPYFALRSYTDGGEHYDGQIGAEQSPRDYVAALLECTREWMRVLKPTGSIFVNLGDKYSTYEGPRSVIQNSELGRRQNAASQIESVRYVKSAPLAYGIPYKSLMMLPERYRIGCVDDLGLIARAVLVWSKPNGLPESVTDRVRRSHEDWVHLTKQPRYYSSVDAIRTPHSRSWGPGNGGTRPMVAHAGGGHQYDGLNSSRPNALGALPGSVWEIPTEPLKVPAEVGVDHFAAFPTEWPRRIIQGWSPGGGTVLDPFGGTGTTALVASVLGRRGVSVDMSADYCRLARWRTADPAQRAKAARQPKPAQQLEGQGDLFEFVEAVA